MIPAVATHTTPSGYTFTLSGSETAPDVLLVYVTHPDGYTDVFTPAELKQMLDDPHKRVARDILLEGNESMKVLLAFAKHLPLSPST